MIGFGNAPSGHHLENLIVTISISLSRARKQLLKWNKCNLAVPRIYRSRFSETIFYDIVC